MEEDSLRELIQTMGLGEIPIINHVNEALHRQLIENQLEVAHLEAEIEQTSDEVDQLFNYMELVLAEDGTKKYFIQARKEELEGERDLKKISINYWERGSKDEIKVAEVVDIVDLEVEALAKKVESAKLVVDLVEEENLQDQSMITKSTVEAENVEKDILEVLKFHFDDETQIKASHLKIGKLQMELNEQKSNLDESSTVNKMSQMGLQKTALEFRRIHGERQEAMCKWSEAIELAKARDKQIKELFESINKIKERGRKRSLDLKQQELFLKNEVKNNSEVDQKIKEVERQVNRLDDLLKVRERELEDIENELALEDRLTMKAGAEISSKRKRIKECKQQRNALRKRQKALEATLQEMKDKQFKATNSMLSAGDKAKAMDKIFSSEERHRDQIKWDLDKVRQKRFQREHELKDADREEETLQINVKALKMERINLNSRTRATKGHLTKKEDLASGCSFRISTLERELDTLQGRMSSEARSELKKELEVFKEELEARKTDKRNMDHLLHKIEADVRKIARDIEGLSQDVDSLTYRIEDVSLESENSKKRHAHWRGKVENLILEEKLLQVAEQKAKEELNALNHLILELSKEMIAKDEDFRKRRAHLEAQKEALSAQLKHMREDMRLIKQEVRRTQEQSDKIKIRYDHLTKSLGDSKKTSEDKAAPSHAYHLVHLAQEKAELQDQANLMEVHLQKEERELLDLQKTMSLLRNSNDKYRASNLTRDMLETDEIKKLQGKLKPLNDAMERSKNELEALEAEIKLKEFQLLKTDSEIEMAQAAEEERKIDLDSLKEEVRAQNQKLERAKKQQDRQSEALKLDVTNGDQYEQDMDLRRVKEQQRGTLIKLRELSIGDPNFSGACQAQIEKLGLAVPTLSRLELQSSSGYQRRSLSASRDGLSSAKNAATKTSFYRRSAAAKRASNAMTRSSSTNSLLVMELNQVAPTMDINPTRTQLPVIN